MAPRKTRSKPAPAKSPSPEPQLKQLPSADENPPVLLIVPSNLSGQARIISLQHPRTLKLCRFLWCPVRGLFELHKSAPPSHVPSSWLIARGVVTEGEEWEAIKEAENQSLDETKPIEDGYVLQDAGMLVATPFDPLFLLQPLFVPGFSENQARIEDDHFEKLNVTSTHMKHLLMRENFKKLLVQRLGTVSEQMDIVDDTLYKPNPRLFLQKLVEKAKLATEPGAWPASLEEIKIQRELEIPMTVEAQIEKEELEGDAQQEECDLAADGSASELQAGGQAPTTSSGVPETVVKLMRLDVCLDYIMSAYVQKELHEHFKSIIALNELIDFTELNQHREKVKKAREEAKVLRSISDNASRKRVALEEDEFAEIRADKRRKKEEEEQKKKSESRAVRDLKKADTSGMKKLSAFFAPKTKS